MSDKVSFGRRLAPIVVADIAREQPHKLYGSIARTSNPQDGFDDMTYLRFANAINRASWWLERTFGRSTTFETIAYSGPFDLRIPSSSSLLLKSDTRFVGRQILTNQ